MKSRTAFAAALFASAVSVRVFAQPSGVPSDPQLPKEMPEYGTTGASSVRIPAWDFSRMDGGPVGVGAGVSRFPPDGALPFLVSSVHVPGGTKITRVELDYCDNSSSGKHVSLELLQCDNQGQNCASVTSGLVSSSNGCSFVSQSGLSVHVNNYNNMYTMVATFDAGDGTIRLVGAIVTYQLEVSPAPGAATFNDVPTNHPFFQFVEALAASGITGGCGSGNYCPDAPLTRGQMAVFLAKALGLHWNNE
jgi:hypothetical protein